MADMKTINIAPTSWTPFLNLAREEVITLCQEAARPVDECYTYAIIGELIAFMEKVEKFVKESA